MPFLHLENSYLGEFIHLLHLENSYTFCIWRIHTLENSYPFCIWRILTLENSYTFCIWRIHTPFAFGEFIPWRIHTLFAFGESYLGEFIPILYLENHTLENSYPFCIWRIHTLENSYPFWRSWQRFLLITQVIDFRLERSRLFLNCQKRIFNYIIINYIKRVEYIFLTKDRFWNLDKSLARKSKLTFRFNLHILFLYISR